MATHNLSDMVRDVRAELDELQINPSGFAVGSDNEDLDTIIKIQIGKSIEFCYAHADLSMMAPNERFTSPTFIDTDGIHMKNAPTGVYVARVDLDQSQPSYQNTKFLRLCYARCSSWSRDVTEPVYWTDASAGKLKDWFTTGAPERPVVYIWRDAITGHMIADLYTTDDGDSVEVAIVRKPDYVVTAEQTVDIDNRLYDAIVMYAAGLALVTLKDEHADALLNQALVLMGAQINKSNVD